jgi:hypothetical protein
MFNKTMEIQMFTEIPRLVTTAFSMAHVLWYSGSYARRFNLQTGRKVFYLRYRALVNNRACGAAKITPRQPARFC